MGKLEEMSRGSDRCGAAPFWLDRAWCGDKERKVVRNVFRVFLRDLKRIAKAPASWAVMAFLIVLPSLYTWFNVLGFWDPYNNTGQLHVCVVNEDTGTTDDLLGTLDLGNQIVDELHENSQLDWDFVDRDSAMAELDSGTAYAVFVIPSSFSADMATILSADFQRPQLEYYVNEKLGPVSPKITDTGASTLDTTINDTFVSTVASTVAAAFNSALADSRADFDSSKSTVAAELDKVSADLQEARDAVSLLNDASAQGVSKADEAKASLSDAKAEIADTALILTDVGRLTGEVTAGVAGTVDSLDSALNKGSVLVSDAASDANAAVGKIDKGIQGANGAVQTVSQYVDDLYDANNKTIASLKEDVELVSDKDVKKALEDSITALSAANANLKAQAGSDGQLGVLGNSLAATSTSISKASNSMNDAASTTLDAADSYRDTLKNDTLPRLNTALGSIGTTATGLAGTVAQQTALIDQTSAVLDQMKTTLGSASDALAQTDGLLADVQKEIDTVRTDVVALGTSNALGELFGDNGEIDVDKVADFMQSPTQVKTEELYPLNAYGSAMAPLFINLTLWIGVFMLMVIMHIEVDDEGIKNLTIAQRYLGRGLLFAILVSLQAAVCVAGCLFLGAQTVSAPAFFLTAIACSLTYLAIQYTLSTTLQHIGKGLCVILVFVQIPAATGLYPVELTTNFFRTIYPVFPFTYGINAMRETICGFYGNAWANCMGVLGLFFVIFLLAGIFLRPFLTNTNRMFARQLAETDIINHEAVQLPERRYRVTQIIRAMSNHGEFREYLDERSARFFRLYPKLKRGALVFGVGVPVVFTVLMAFLSPGKKVIMLSGWLLWFVLVIVFLLVVEHIRDSLERQAALETMSDEELRGLFSERNKVTCTCPDGEDCDCDCIENTPADLPADKAEGGDAR